MLFSVCETFEIIPVIQGMPLNNSRHKIQVKSTSSYYVHMSKLRLGLTGVKAMSSIGTEMLDKLKKAP